MVTEIRPPEPVLRSARRIEMRNKRQPERSLTMSIQWDEYADPALNDPLRAAVRGAIEEASGQALSVDDPLPDTLIAAAQAIGIRPRQLRLWIYDEPKPEW